MSNCVNILNDVVIPLDQVAKPRSLKARILTATAVRNPEVGDTWAWFLTTDNVWFEKDALCIRLGEARSGHTWRDLKATLIALSKYLVPDVYIPLELTDEYDGHEDVIRVDIHASSGKAYEVD